MEQRENIVQVKSFALAVRIMKLHKWLIEHKVPYKVAEQLLKSGTSVGANIEEAIGGFTKKEFSMKIGIAYKEARETRYWLKLLQASDYLPEKMALSFLEDCDELVKLLSSIQKTTLENLRD